MNDPQKTELVRNWLRKAQSDLKSARRLSASDDPIYDTAIYHCQQCAEKVVKGFLVFHDAKVEKTHDVAELIEIAAQIETSFQSWLDKGEFLTPFATEYRYPADEFEPEAETFEAALKEATALFEYVLRLLPTEAHP